MERLQEWNRNILTRAENEILLKIVIQAVPNDLMNQLEKAVNQFWWVNFSAGSTGIHWSSWSGLAWSKIEGALVSRIYNARYFHKCGFLEANILASQELLRRGCLKQIGSGTETLVFSDPWIPSLGVDNRSWDNEALHSLFSPEERAATLRIPVSYTTTDDSWFWLEEHRGIYSIKSGYRLLVNGLYHLPSISAGLWLSLWKVDVPKKILNFVWRAVSNHLLVLSRLIQHKVEVHNCFPVCAECDETIIHSLYNCSFTKALYQRAMGFFIAWKLWIHRNGKVWKNKLSTIGVVWDHVLQGLDEWHLAQASKLSIWQPTAEAFALILRNEYGHSLGGCMMALGGVDSPALAEALYKNVVAEMLMETDCMILSYFGSLVLDIKSLMSDVNSIAISFVKKSAR
ncbi:hypothetical protein MANES_04G054132v8 [Manihot esculenta]|uniref:Uncharacterized protein n=1 Tax=Manihot esculenta TaxID=3983 RepID=A0ACB7HSQ3_MANES|nr:hypothetical protein MANES_04G054132v8 [Manihot esculenta]